MLNAPFFADVRLMPILLRVKCMFISEEIASTRTRVAGRSFAQDSLMDFDDLNFLTDIVFPDLPLATVFCERVFN